MLEGQSQKPLGKNEPFRMEREGMGTIREGDFVESRYKKVTFVDEERREALLKGLDAESVIARRDLELLRVGTVLEESGVKTLEERYGPSLFRAEREKYRVMYVYGYSGGASVWVGPPELTVQDAAIFKQLMESGERRGIRFEKCRPVDINEVKRVLDS